MFLKWTLLLSSIKGRHWCTRNSLDAHAHILTPRVYSNAYENRTKSTRETWRRIARVLNECWDGRWRKWNGLRGSPESENKTTKIYQVDRWEAMQVSAQESCGGERLAHSVIAGISPRRSPRPRWRRARPLSRPVCSERTHGSRQSRLRTSSPCAAARPPRTARSRYCGSGARRATPPQRLQFKITTYPVLYLILYGSRWNKK